MGGTQIQAHEAVSRCIAVLDVGTTAVKACLFSPSLELLACSVQEYALRTQGERVEADAAQYKAAARAGLADALSQAPGCIPAAVSITTQGETLTLADRSGEPLRPFLVWLDSRAENEAQALRSVLDNETFYKTTGLPEVTGALPLAKLLWLRKHEPDTFARAHKLLLLEDYLLHWLTGRFVSEKSLQTSTGWFDLHSDGLWHSGLAAAGASAELLPELLECGAPAGSLLPGPAAELGLPPNIPVVAGAMDQTAAALAAGCTRPGTVTETTGTALVMAACTDAPMFRSGHHVTVYRHALPGKYLYLPIGNTAGMALRWFRDEFCPRPSRRSSGICSAGRAGAKRPLRVRRAGVPAVFIRQRGSRRLSRSPRRILRRAAFHHAGPFRPQRDGIRRVSAAGLFRHAERSGLSRRHRVLAGRRRTQRCVAADQSRCLRPHVPRARVQRGHRHGCRPFGRVGQRTHRPRRFPLPRRKRRLSSRQRPRARL